MVIRTRQERTLDALPHLLLTAAAAYVSTNVDGYALLLGFFSNARYREVDIVVGQYASMAAQMALSIAITQSGWMKEAPIIGFAGIVPLIVGLRRIASLRQSAEHALRDAGHPATIAKGRVGRIAAVTVVATSGAIDNVLVYASVLIGRASDDILSVACTFGVLTAALCALAFFTARSRFSMNALRMLAARIAPFMTTAIGVSMLIRFDTLVWIYSLA
jgi:cadmium resistance protein CadD (predicted permease)